MLSLALSALSLNNAPLRAGRAPTKASVSMKVEDLVGGINDPIFGGTPEGKIFDPLGLGADEASLYRRRCVEIKHGRVCMVAFLGMTVGPNDVRAARAPQLHVMARRRALCLRRRSRSAPAACAAASLAPIAPLARFSLLWLSVSARAMVCPPTASQLFTPSHALLSPSLDLHFDDIPGGIAAIDAVPAAGWLQIFALVGVHELTVAKQVIALVA